MTLAFDFLVLEALPKMSEKQAYRSSAYTCSTFRDSCSVEVSRRDVSDITKAPAEMLGGRVKTLHPAVHGGMI